MIGSRDKSLRRLGASLAGLALYIQLAFAGWAALVLTMPGDPADVIGGHALCLAGVAPGEEPPAPADNAPVAPAHDHTAFCCLGHLAPSVAPQAAATQRPLAYALLARRQPGDTVFIPIPQRGPANARAPPTLA